MRSIRVLLLLGIFVFTFSHRIRAEEANHLVSDYNSHEAWNWYVQSTLISQGDSKMDSPYSGQNSLSPAGEFKTSFTATAFLGAALWKDSSFFVNPEVAAGSGLSATHGIAGFPNGEIYRVDDPAPKPNLSRFYLQQIIGLGGEKELIESDKNQLRSQVDQERITLIAGKFSLNDFFDNNTYSHDPRTQFFNWSLMDNGAWDYAADTRGYTWGLYVEYNRPKWAIRVATVMVPIRANVMEMDPNILQAHGDNAEFEYRYSIYNRNGKARLLGYMNHADMGNYQSTLQAALNDPSLGMDVTTTRQYSLKYGFGLNLEQEVTKDLGLFARVGWNNGQTETWAFTEVDHTASLGVALKGALWSRRDDNAGIAWIVNGLSREHMDYLAAGGYGFIIGDGQLNYAPEQIAELYYLFKPARTVGISADFQWVNHPGYNQDRGDAAIIATRMHYEI